MLNTDANRKAYLWVPFTFLYFTRCLYVYQYQWADEEEALERVKELWPAMNQTDHCNLSPTANETSDEVQRLFGMPFEEISVVCSGFVLLVLPLALLLIYHSRNYQQQEDHSVKQKNHSDHTISLHRLMLRFTFNFTVMQSLFILFTVIPRLLSNNRGATSTEVVEEILTLIHDNNDIKSLLNKDTWSILQNMWYISHKAHIAWLSHVFAHWSGFWIYFAPDVKSLLKAVFWSSVCLIIALITHGMESPELYCIRNTFLSSWTSASSSHILVHTASDVPIGLATVLGIF